MLYDPHDLLAIRVLNFVLINELPRAGGAYCDDQFLLYQIFFCGQWPRASLFTSISVAIFSGLGLHFIIS